ncbi:BatD family protein [Marilutibacter alkalisoli]|uniref:Protein BatD n=1 Tax=Marilutibacter alkalisoli TaxID=2591633 RepID=A0A514BQ70_9GAMM|nr:BatD family protein [Lysobacter alkalisoli]QDH69179.1 protein BatD [Lysobacter alkalisoli]
MSQSSTHLPSFPGRFVLFLLLGLLAGHAGAATRAWLDRDRIALGETVTLNIETDATASASPDYAPLETEFGLSGHTSRRGNRRSLFAVALKPRRDGVLTVPAIRVGNERTSPLSLVVTPADDRPVAGAGEDVFIESGPDHSRPYVQQSVGWVVRLYAAVPIVTGTLDQPIPDGVAFQRVGNDAQYSRTMGGRRYQVIERRYMLIPEHSGELRVPGATFEGRSAASFFDDMFGGRRGNRLQAQAPAHALQVQSIPADAPQPWLPLHDLQLRYRANPSGLRQGHAATLTIEALADGATATQMPELELPPIDGVQVFAERPQIDETFVDGRPRVKLTRSFSLVPDRAGEVQLSGVRMDWWDVAAGQTRSATLPALSWTVRADAGDALAKMAPTTDASAPTPVVSPRPSDRIEVPASADDGNARYWAAAAALFAMLWLATLLWGLHRRQPMATAKARAATVDGVAVRPDPSVLRQALDMGSFEDVAEALCAMAQPPVATVDAVIVRLDDPAQRQAVEAMQRARWAGGDGPGARDQLRTAFVHGPRWKAVVEPEASPLPPLYPRE